MFLTQLHTIFLGRLCNVSNVQFYFAIFWQMTEFRHALIHKKNLNALVALKQAACQSVVATGKTEVFFWENA